MIHQHDWTIGALINSFEAPWHYSFTCSSSFSLGLNGLDMEQCFPMEKNITMKLTSEQVLLQVLFTFHDIFIWLWCSCILSWVSPFLWGPYWNSYTCLCVKTSIENPCNTRGGSHRKNLGLVTIYNLCLIIEQQQCLTMICSITLAIHRCCVSNICEVHYEIALPAFVSNKKSYISNAFEVFLHRVLL